MGDENEGETPYQGRYCSCGLRADLVTLCRLDTCPDCKAAWPEALRTRYPYDGGPEIRTLSKEEAAKHMADHRTNALRRYLSELDDWMAFDDWKASDPGPTLEDAVEKIDKLIHLVRRHLGDIE